MSHISSYYEELIFTNAAGTKSRNPSSYPILICHSMQIRVLRIELNCKIGGILTKEESVKDSHWDLECSLIKL